MLKNEVIIASSSALSQSVLHQSQAAPLRVKTQPGMKLELVIDGIKQTGKAPLDPDHKRLLLKRVGADLLVVSETDEILATLEDYFASQNAVLSGQDWIFVADSPAYGFTTSEIGLVSTGDATAAALGNAGQLVELSALPGMVSATGSGAVLGALLVGGAAVGLTGGGNGSTEIQSQPVAVVIKGVITAGPVLRGNDLYVVAYAADGKTELGRDESVEAGGAYEFSLVKGYTGPVILRVYSRSSAVPDYMDEALLAPSNLSTVISAVALISQGMTEKIVNVNMVTDLAARMAGVKTVTSGVSESANVVAINQAMSKAVGLGADEIINYTPSTTVDVNGKTNPNPNLIGYLLDWMSHMAHDSLGGDVEKVQQNLLENLTLAGGVVTVTGGMQDGIRQSQTMTAATSPTLTISDSEPGTAKGPVLFTLNFSC
jgi:hypothetical protein